MNKYTNQSKWHRLEKQNCSLHRITAKHRSTSKLRAYTRNVNIIFLPFLFWTKWRELPLNRRTLPKSKTFTHLPELDQVAISQSREIFP